MLQVMPEKDAETYAIHPFDLTKVWPHKDYPLIEVGVMELNSNPLNYFAEIEQAAFEPSNMPPGIGASPDKVLQARLLSYPDAHRYRIGVNYASLPVNQPKCPVMNYQRDGHMRFDGNSGGAPNYEPNSFGGPIQDPSVKEPPLKINGDADHFDHWNGNEDYWTQPGNLYRLMTNDEKLRLFSNIIGAMQDVPREIQLRQVKHFYKADSAYGEGVARGLGIIPIITDEG
jgi:catalase